MGPGIRKERVRSILEVYRRRRQDPTAPAMTVKATPVTAAPITWPTIGTISKPPQGWDQELED
jgi:hypothetical protein